LVSLLILALHFLEGVSFAFTLCDDKESIDWQKIPSTAVRTDFKEEGDADVRINIIKGPAGGNALCGQVPGFINASDYVQSLKHEIGHVFGLSHSPIKEAVMKQGSTYGEDRAIHQDDIEGISKIFPCPEGKECTENCFDDNDCPNNMVCI
jgi:hypothetical protein